MATTAKALFRGAAGTASTTLYTVPSATTAVVTNIVVTNTSGSAQDFTLTLDAVDLATEAPLAANSIAIFDLKQVLVATDVIAGLASATDVNFHISGVEIA
jgi:hypothetical protein